MAGGSNGILITVSSVNRLSLGMKELSAIVIVVDEFMVSREK
jgi:hypothetical protein